MNMQEFIQAHGLTMLCTPVQSNPCIDDATMRHYSCTIARGQKRMTVHYSMGSAFSKPPTLADVLDCISADALSVETNDTFESWCAEFDYDTDSRKAERIYNLCERYSAELRELLGDEAHKTLLWEVERD
jgi:hypothetical protein